MFFLIRYDAFFQQLIVIGIYTFLSLKYMLGYGIISSLIEFNGIFLHGRQLLLMYGFSKTSLVYKANRFLNILTYVIFRLGILCMLFLFIADDCGRLTPFLCYGFHLADAILLVINVILFYRLIKSDFLGKEHKDDGNILVNNNLNGKTD